jgi:thiamine biosynthesis lipoprotein
MKTLTDPPPDAPTGMDAARIALPDDVDAEALRRCDPTLPVTMLSGRTMGTVWRIHAVVPRGMDPQAIRHVTQTRLDALVAQMSHWEAASDLCRFNRLAAGECAVLPDDFAQVMQAAVKIARDSGGAFSPSIGRLVDLWGFGPPGPVALEPDAEALAAALSPSDWQLLTFEPDTRRLRQPGGMALDLSAIAKGYGVDAVMRDLAAMGLVHALVEVGGELSGRGLRPDGQPWWVDLEVPPGVVLPTLRVGLHGLSVATSGSYVRGLHNLDPRTGVPAGGGVAACSVLHGSAMEADAWASAFTVLGEEEGLILATRRNLAVRWVMGAGEGARERLSPALLAMMDEETGAI